MIEHKNMSEKIVEKTTAQSQNKTETTVPTASFSRIKWGESYVSLILGALVVIVAAFLGVFYVKLHQPKQELLPPVSIVRQMKLTVTPEVSFTPTATPSVKPQVAVKPTVTQTKQIAKKEIKNKNEKIYVVEKNDNLWTIAQKIYGSGYSWVSIAQANHLANPGMVFSGDRLIIPSVSPIAVQNKPEQILPTITQKKQIAKTVSPKPTATVVPQQIITQQYAISGAVYTVKTGDSLWNIAVRAYNNGYKWVDIAKANNLTNPSIIHSGNVLKIPHN